MSERTKIAQDSNATYGANSYPKAGLDFTSEGQPILQGPDGTNLGRFVRAKATITSAAAATAVSLIPDSMVGAGEKCYLMDFIGRVNGTTVWATTSTVKIQDTNSSAVDFVTAAVAALTSQARIYPGTANVTSEDAYSLGTGGTAGKGLQLKGNANGTGSDLVISALVWIG